MISSGKLCRFWALTFVGAGLAFALAPDLVAALLDGIARAVGLTPGIPVARASLWFPLALSLMATIAYLAWEAGAPGAPPVAFRALVLSKIASTAGFAALAVGLASGWWLCAATDGFIALTLLLARAAERARAA